MANTIGPVLISNDTVGLFLQLVDPNGNTTPQLQASTATLTNPYTASWNTFTLVPAPESDQSYYIVSPSHGYLQIIDTNGNGNLVVNDSGGSSTPVEGSDSYNLFQVQSHTYYTLYNAKTGGYLQVVDTTGGGNYVIKPVSGSVGVYNQFTFTTIAGLPSGPISAPSA